MPSLPGIKTGISKIKSAVKITEVLSKEVEKSLDAIYKNPGKFKVELGGSKDHGHAIEFVTISSAKAGNSLGLLFHIGDKSIVMRFGEDPSLVESKPGKRTVNPHDIGASELGYPEIHFDLSEEALKLKIAGINQTRERVGLPALKYEIKKMQLNRDVNGKTEALAIWTAVPKVS